jgi:heme o synthase
MSGVRTESLEQTTGVTALKKALQVTKAYITLTKPRIMMLLLFTAYCAAVAAQRGIPSFDTTVGLLVGLGLSTGGSAAINMWYDRDIDRVMSRTQQRPIVTGQVSAAGAFCFGIILGVLSFIVLYFTVNPVSAYLSTAGYIYYAVVYTMWLKRTTPQNIVVGGGAGAFPPLIGWAAVTGHVSLAAIIMFAIIFFWTPAHFWSLALYKNADYVRANIPMMPVVRGARVTKLQCVVYNALLLGVSVLLYFTGAVGMTYLIAAIVLGVLFLIASIRMWFESDTEFVWVRRTFVFSLMYLPLLFVFIVLGSL